MLEALKAAVTIWCDLVTVDTLSTVDTFTTINRLINTGHREGAIKIACPWDERSWVPALDHRLIRLKALLDGFQTEFIETAERGQTGRGEDSVEHVEVFRVW